MTIDEFQKKAQQRDKITMITCYDYTSACIVNSSDIDGVLVGDSAAMVMQGKSTTIHATVDQMCLYTQSVARAIKQQLIVADLPFMSYRQSLAHTVDVVKKMLWAGAHAVKLEGVDGNLATINHLVKSGVPVMGHIGLTPQHVHVLGGFKVQGKGVDQAQIIYQQAQQLEAHGCFAIVLECVPQALAKAITEAVSIPTIGIGAGADTDGQILVFQDVLGLSAGHKPKFVKSYLNGAGLFRQSINQFAGDVRQGLFPSSDFSYRDQ